MLREAQVKRGNIYMLDLPAIGSVQGGYRPYVVVSNDTGNLYSSIAMLCPITSRMKKNLPTHIQMQCRDDCLNKNSTVLTEVIRTVPQEMLTEYIGKATSAEMTEVSVGLVVSIGIASSLQAVTDTIKKLFPKKCFC